MIIERIYICPVHGGVQVECEQVALEAGRGIVGDRSFGKNAYPGQSVTLVEAEEIERFCVEQGRPVDLAMTRRNLVTRGVRLNALMGKEFSVGTAKLKGVDLCEPCSALGDRLADTALAPADVVRRWVGRAGLLAEVLASGVIEPGARIEAGD
ncbi:MAG: MOSC domain-containing protein [Azonexus sp.]|nr:MOSC domain-containing protein [Azonexus sp.]